jgi:pyrimidine-nucleoside phosphorylase
VTPAEFIRVKRDGGRHDAESLEAFVRGWVDGSVMAEQAAAWTMAVFLQGLDGAETVALTRCMRDSGRTMERPPTGRPRIDKHSTGGVGDKVSLCLAPLVAACGVDVPMVSGRGLGHTGGTLDKLSAVPGFSADLDPARFEAILQDCGMVMAGASRDLAPADRLLYGVRDACATVESIPLIVSSILSKKLAAGIDGLVLDVKVGCGAFMPNLDRARALAEELVRVAVALGCPVRAVLSDMDAPLGQAVGNAAELAEAMDVLQGGGPGDLWELTRTLGVQMLGLAGVAADEAKDRLERARAAGDGLERLHRTLRAQGATGVDRVARWREGLRGVSVPAERSGFVAGIDARAVGEAAMALGAGRRRRTDPIDVGPAVLLRVERGDRVEAGEPWAELWVRPDSKLEPVLARLQPALSVAAHRVSRPLRVLEVHEGAP